jgi:flavin-dependent dehydrogenase
LRIFDVLIAGGGPAGCAAAIALRTHAPGLSVCIADAPRDNVVVLGETLPPPATAMLRQLGVLERFVEDGHERAFRTVSAWGSPETETNEFLGHVHQHGWRLDRPRFDAMLKLRALEQGAQWIDARISGLALHDKIWTTECGIASRFAIDATGRAAALSRSLPQAPRPVRLDRLIACIVHFENSPRADTSVETFEHGWWLTTGLADGRLLVALMSDSDVVRHLGVADASAWHEHLQRTQLTRSAAQGGHPYGPPRLVAAGSLRQATPLGLPLLAAGDAASCFDPLSSQGIVKALRSGAFAAYAAADFLNGDARGIARYRAFIEEEFDAYRRTWRDHYLDETRWPGHAFWRRRRVARASASGPAFAASTA